MKNFNKFKKLAFCLALLLSNNLSNAQSWECGTQDDEGPTIFSSPCFPNSSTWLNHYRTPNHWIPDESTPPKTILMNIIVFQDSLGGNAWHDSPEFYASLELQEYRVNEYFYNIPLRGYPLTCDPDPEPEHVFDSKIRVEYNEVIFIQDSYLNSLTLSGTGTLANYLFANYPETRNVLNFMWTKSGTTSFGWGHYVGNANGEAVLHNHDAMYNPDYAHHPDVIDHIAHELGHALGIHHVYDSPTGVDEYLDTQHYDFLSDVFGTCTEPIISSPVSTCFNGCTPPVNHVCFFTHCFWNELEDQINNGELLDSYPFVGGYGPARYISPKMAGRFHRALSMYDNTFRLNNKHMNRYVKEKYSYEIPYEITQNETWDFAIKMYQDIVVKTGNTLTITCEVRMPLDGKIIVEPGAKLILDDGLITCAHDGMWQGIEVLGNSSLNQNPANQGSVRVINNGVIKNAKVGISLGRLNANSSVDLSSTGGYTITSTGATFLNCQRAIAAYDYQSPSGSANFTQINNTTFDISEELPDGLLPYHQVYMRGVRGVQIKNSTFKNSRTDEFSVLEAGGGIAATKSNFIVKDNIFSKLNNGIRVKSPSFDHIDISENEFDLNLGGILIQTAGLANITSNSFLIPAISELEFGASSSSEPFGVFLLGCTGYEVEENDFRANTRDRNVGIAIKESGPTYNELYNNQLQNLEAGIIAMGNNRDDNNITGLKLRCNDLGLFDYPLDFSIALTAQGEVAEYQGVFGLEDGGVGNTFYPLCAPEALEREFYVEGGSNYNSNVVYIPFEQGFTRPDCHTSDFVEVDESIVEFVKEFNCPSNISSGGVIGEFGQKFLLNKSILQTLKEVYDNTANGGDTQYLLNLIANPNVTSFDLRNELLLSSPDLTDRVMMEAIERDPAMNYWHIAQVLLANSPLPRNVINLLERSDIDAYYQELVLNGQNGGMTNIVIKEMEISHFNAQKERARRDYVSLAYINDSTLAWNDSIIHYLSVDANVHQLKTLLSYHIMHGHIQQSTDLLNNASTYGWSSDYQDIMNVLLDAKQDTSGAENTIRANQTMLESIAADTTHDALLAQAVLETYGLANFEHQIIFPNPQPKSLKQRNKKSITKTAIASVHPNPAKNQIYLNWKLPEGMNPEKVMLTVYNVQGKLVLSNTLNQEVGIQEINISNYSTGIYLYQLRHEDILLHSEKFEVLR